MYYYLTVLEIRRLKAAVRGKIRVFGSLYSFWGLTIGENSFLCFFQLLEASQGLRLLTSCPRLHHCDLCFHPDSFLTDSCLPLSLIRMPVVPFSPLQQPSRLSPGYDSECNHAHGVPFALYGHIVTGSGNQNVNFRGDRCYPAYQQADTVDLKVGMSNVGRDRQHMLLRKNKVEHYLN